MITLYYTGANSYNGYQPVPADSLGGYISQNQLPNGRLNNLFPDESYSDNKIGSMKLIAIALTTDVAIADLTMSSSNDPTVDNYTLEIAAVSMVNNQKMEQINDPSDLPYVGTFYPIDKNTPVNIGGVAAASSIGIWIKRTLKAAPVKTCSDISTSGINPTTNTFQLTFTF